MIGVNDSQLQNATLTLMFLEVAPANARSSSRGGSSIGLADADGVTWTRHLNGVNLAFADGHVKWYVGNEGTTKNSKIYAVNATFATSGQSPTFHVSDGLTEVNS